MYTFSKIEKKLPPLNHILALPTTNKGSQMHSFSGTAIWNNDFDLGHPVCTRLVMKFFTMKLMVLMAPIITKIEDLSSYVIPQME